MRRQGAAPGEIRLALGNGLLTAKATIIVWRFDATQQ